jgi:hypothetical protein
MTKPVDSKSATADHGNKTSDNSLERLRRTVQHHRAKRTDRRDPARVLVSKRIRDSMLLSFRAN